MNTWPYSTLSVFTFIKIALWFPCKFSKVLASLLQLSSFHQNTLVVSFPFSLQLPIRYRWWLRCDLISNFKHNPLVLSSFSLNNGVEAYYFLLEVHFKWFGISFPSILWYTAYLASFFIWSLNKSELEPRYFVKFEYFYDWFPHFSTKVVILVELVSVQK